MTDAATECAEERLGLGIGIFLAEMTDPRRVRCRLHSLDELFTIVICAVVAGADNWVAIETFAKAREDWFGGLLPLPNGVPSHDTTQRQPNRRFTGSVRSPQATVLYLAS